MVRSKKDKGLTNRQVTTLKALRKLRDTDSRKDSPWNGAFGVVAVALITGQSGGKTSNDIQALQDLGFVEPELNLLYRITEAGEKELDDGSEV